MNTQAKVALDKQQNPDRYCKVAGCLWKVKHLVTDLVFGQVYIFHDNCPGGRCPRHQPKIRNLALEIAQGLNNQTHKEKP